MTLEQRYFFDLTGYLHLQQALCSEELELAQQAAQRYIDTPNEQLSPGFEFISEREHFNWYVHAFAFDKALEALTFHPQTWQPKNRERRFLTLRYSQQHMVRENPLPEGVLAKLSPETHELVATLPFTEIKAIAERDVVHLT